MWQRNRSTIIFLLLFVGLVITLQLCFPAVILWPSQSIRLFLYSVSGALSIALGSFLFLETPFRSQAIYFPLIGAAFFALGTLALLDPMAGELNGAIWLKAASLFVGALFLNTIWLPRAWVKKYVTERTMTVVTLALIVPIAVFSWIIWNETSLLAPVTAERTFSAGVRAITLSGGALFLTAAWRIARVTPAPESDLLVTVCIYLGLSSIPILFSHLWGIGWWTLQVARLVPFLHSSVFILGLFRSNQRALFDSERRYRALADELGRTNAELKRFSSVVSHDLKAPLRTITTHVQLAQRQLGKNIDPEVGELFASAVESCQRMASLIDDLLAYSSVTHKDRAFAPVDVSRVLSDVLASIAYDVRTSGAQIDAGTLPTVTADEPQIFQLLQNLVGNAIKYRGDRAPRVKITVSEDPAGWHFAVEDNGIGFPMDQAEKIFEEFQRLHGQREYPGTGLGLPICRAIVTRHGGRIWAESAPGRGSTFHFTLPRRADAGAPPKNVPAAAEAPLFVTRRA